MKTVPVYEAKSKLSELLAAVEQGEQVTITQHGRPVARLVAANEGAEPAQAQRERVAGNFAKLRALRAAISLDMDIREAVGECRD
jgi:prevent-host-death family protein